jgi:hypothetical protein
MLEIILKDLLRLRSAMHARRGGQGTCPLAAAAVGSGLLGMPATWATVLTFF